MLSLVLVNAVIPSNQSGAVDILLKLQRQNASSSENRGSDRTWSEHKVVKAGRRPLFSYLSQEQNREILNRVVNFKGELTLKEVGKIYQDVTKVKTLPANTVIARLIDDLQIRGLVSESNNKARSIALRSLSKTHAANLN